MKLSTFAAIVAILMFAMALMFSCSSRPDIPWMVDYHAALRLSKKLNKPLLVSVVEHPLCRDCEYMDMEIFNTEEFLSYSRKFVLYRCRLSRHKTPLTPFPTDLFVLIHKTPAIMVLTPEGKFLGSLGGYARGHTVAYYKGHINEFLALGTTTKH